MTDHTLAFIQELLAEIKRLKEVEGKLTYELGHWRVRYPTDPWGNPRDDSGPR